MLEILNLDIDNQYEKQIEEEEKKYILLCDTKRRLSPFLKSFNRFSEKILEAPHYVIKKNGEIFSFLPINKKTKTFENEHFNSFCIKIMLENLGWFKKDPITNTYKNWINDTYRSEVYAQEWRGYYYWDEYSEPQINSLTDLCYKISNEKNIDFNFRFNDIIIGKLRGIIPKYNFSDIYTDINPSISKFNLYGRYEKH